MVSVGWGVTNVGAIAGSVAVAYSVSLPAIGLFTAVLFLAHLLSQVPGGRLTDRHGGRRVALVSAGLMATGNVAALAAPIWGLALMCRLLTGVGTGLAVIAGTALIREARGRSLAQGLYGAAGVAGPGAALFVVPMLEPSLGWHAPFATGLACALIAGAALLAIAPPARSAPAQASRTRLTALARDRELLRLGLIHSASFGASVVAANWIVEFLERDDWSTVSAAAVGSTLVLAGAPGRLLGGWVLERRPDAVRSSTALSLLVGGASLAMVVLSPPLALALAAAAAAGLCAGIPFAATFGAAGRIRQDAPATAAAIVNGSSSVSVVVGTPLLGLTFASQAGARAGLLAVAALWAGALVVALGMRDPAIEMTS
jgi:MFS family permease